MEGWETWREGDWGCGRWNWEGEKKMKRTGKGEIGGSGDGIM